MSEQSLAEEVALQRILLNRKYYKIICTDEKCGKAIPQSKLYQHLRQVHDVKAVTAVKAQMMLKGLGWRWGEGCDVRPANGLKPVEGIQVVNGFRCRECEGIIPGAAKEALHHWNQARHWGGKGALVEAVRLQSWTGEGGYWVVEEDMESDDKEGITSGEHRAEEIKGEVRREDEGQLEREEEWGMENGGGCFEEWLVI